MKLMQTSNMVEFAPNCSYRVTEAIRLPELNFNSRAARRERRTKVLSLMRTNSASMRFGFVETSNSLEEGEQSRDKQQGAAPQIRSSSGGPQGKRDAEGRSVVGRKKPLKINLDLSLVSLYPA